MHGRWNAKNKAGWAQGPAVGLLMGSRGKYPHAFSFFRCFRKTVSRDYFNNVIPLSFGALDNFRLDYSMYVFIYINIGR